MLHGAATQEPLTKMGLSMCEKVEQQLVKRGM